MKRVFLSCSLVGLVAVGVGCQANISSGGGGEGSGGAGGMTACTAIPLPPGAPAYGSDTEPQLVAMSTLHGFVTAYAVGGGAPAGNDISDPRAVSFFFNDAPRTCAQIAADPPCGAHWQVSVTIPPERAHAGTIALSDPDVVATATTPGAMAQGCSATSAPLTTGTLEIKSFGNYSEVTLAGSSTPGVPSDGTYTVASCQLPPLPLTGFAIKRPKLPSSFQSTAPVVFSGPESDDPATLYLFLGDATRSCADPWLRDDCSDHLEMVITIPPSLQKPGTVKLGDNRLSSTLMVAIKAAAVGASSYGIGTLEVVSLDASTITVKLTGTAQSGAPFLDGVYTVAICP
ncbi:MAG: hypothetical protein ABJE95_02765 [Byssovorax sp.]